MKTEKIEIRTTPEFKERVKKAADRENKSLSQFISDSVLLLFAQNPDVVTNANQREI